MNKELKVIDFYCKKCKKSMKVSYMVTGNRNYPVLPRVMMKCHHCGRVMTLKNFKEGELLDKVEQDSIISDTYSQTSDGAADIWSQQDKTIKLVVIMIWETLAISVS